MGGRRPLARVRRRARLRVVRSARIVLVAWLLVLVGFWLLSWTLGIGPVEAVEGALAGAASGPWGPLALLAAYALRSVLFLPMTVLTVFAGFLLGPWLGAGVALTGSVASALVSYGMARFVGAGVRGPTREGEGTPGWLARMRSAPFETVLISRLAAVPGDAVNVAAGVWRVPVVPFAVATALGGVPGLLAGVWAGASLEGPFEFGGLQLRPSWIVLSVAMLVGSLAISWILRGRLRRRA